MVGRHCRRLNETNSAPSIFDAIIHNRFSRQNEPSSMEFIRGPIGKYAKMIEHQVC